MFEMKRYVHLKVKLISQGLPFLAQVISQPANCCTFSCERISHFSLATVKRTTLKSNKQLCLLRNKAGNFKLQWKISP